MDQVEKTGEFHLQAMLPVRSSENVKWSAWARLLNRLIHHVAVILQDGRGYELGARFVELPADGLAPGGWLRVDFSLVLVDAVQAEVGEWVKDLIAYGLLCSRREVYTFGKGRGQLSGRKFAQGDLGWQRVE